MSELRERLDPLLARIRARGAGVVVGAWDGQECLVHATGALPAGEGTVFEIGSITKVFTSTLLVDMAAEGLVALDDPVQRHLPEHVRIPVRGRAITLEDLASHRSGLPRLPKGTLWPAFTRSRGDPYAWIGSPELEHAIARTRPRREPERRRVYSNYAVGLLGYVLARQAGCSYDELVQRRICAPLGLEHTGTDVDGERLATGHSRFGRAVSHWHFDALAGAGALRSTAADLLAFLRLHAGEPPGALADAVIEMRRPRPSRGRLKFGLGWVIFAARRQGVQLLIHDGGTGGFRSFAAVSPERRFGTVVLANRVRGVAGIGMGVLRALE